MKKITYFCTVLFLLLAAVAPAAAAPQAGEDTPSTPQTLTGMTNQLMLPVSRSTELGPFTVTGVVMTPANAPLAGVTVSDGAGHSAVTDAYGRYSLTLPAGQYRLTPSKPGYTRTVDETHPEAAYVAVTVNRDLIDQNFTLDAAAQACTEYMQNISFETTYWWNPVSGSSNGHTPYYVSGVANTGTRSGFTGIETWGTTNAPSLSRWRTQRFFIPTNADSASLTLWMLPKSEEPTATPALKAEDGGKIRPGRGSDLEKALVGINTDDPKAMEIMAEMALRDYQYVAVIDGWTNVFLGYIVDDQNLYNSASWMTITPYDLLAYKGRWIKLELGTYNDIALYSTDPVSSAYFDDVSLEVCTPDVVPPTGETCTLRPDLLLNGGFETPNDGIWLPVGDELVMPGWANWPEVWPFAGTYAYRTGLWMSLVNPYPGVPQWSEVYQAFTLPADATRVRLAAWLLPRSSWYGGGPYYYNPNATVIEDESYTAMRDTLMLNDSQYVYIKGPTGRDEIDYLLLKWLHWDSAYWLYRSWDITAFKGQTLSVVFGTANNGFGSNTAMYVDNVALEVCTPTVSTANPYPTLGE